MSSITNYANFYSSYALPALILRINSTKFTKHSSDIILMTLLASKGFYSFKD